MEDLIVYMTMHTGNGKNMNSEKWISVKDSLPIDDEDVLVYNCEDGISTGYFNKQEFRGWSTHYEWVPYMSPTHWMPLPEPPKIEET